MGVPEKELDGLEGNILEKWMMTGGSPISGTPRMDLHGQSLVAIAWPGKTSAKASDSADEAPVCS